MAGLKIITPPTVEPVTVTEVARQLRYDDDLLTDDITGQISAWITAAREWCEGYQNRAYVTQTLELALDCWPCREIELPRPPLQSVVSVKAVDPDGEETPWTDYLTDTYAFVPRIVPKSAWPSGTIAEANGIRIRYVAGYPPLAGQEVEGEALGTGDGESQTYTAAYAPIEPGTLTVYFGGTPTEDYTVDLETGEITCTAGESVAVTADYHQADDYRANIPKRIKQAIILLAAHWHDNGLCDPPQAVYALLGLDRVVPV